MKPFKHGELAKNSAAGFNAAILLAPRAHSNVTQYDCVEDGEWQVYVQYNRGFLFLLT